MGYNDLTAPFEGANDEWNNEEVNYNDEIDAYNDMTLSVGDAVGDGDEWNTEE